MAAVEEDGLGCEHYKRRCAFVSPCCGNIYTCRLCHDDAEDSHEINRHAVKEVKCLICDVVQKVSNECTNCKVIFGKYFCPVCHLYDNIEKGQFHCDGCGICRIGGRDNFYHCPTCDMCLTINMKDSHRCVEKASHMNCPVCMYDLHSSREPIHIPKCTHLVHRDCYKQMIKSGNYACPLCGESTLDMRESWRLLDEEIAQTPMPEEYRDFRVQILCKDCHKESRTLFHVIGMKCQECGSYNTCRAAEPDPHPTTEDDVTDTEDDVTDTESDATSGATSGHAMTTTSGDRVVTHPTDETEDRTETVGVQPSDAS